MRICVIIPMLNEELLVEDTCRALLEQTAKNFSVIFVDNNSSDKTVWKVDNFIVSNRLKNWKVIYEPQKGTGAAADTGVRQAIADGADMIIRTDADCLPDRNWISEASKKISEGYELVAGKMITRTDDIKIGAVKEKILNLLPTVARVFGSLRPLNRGGEYKGSYMMVAGGNVAFTAKTYQESGGFPRTKIEDSHEDRGLINNVRKVTDKYCYHKGMIVAMSARRVKQWGMINTMRWYKDHGYRTAEVDIR